MFSHGDPREDGCPKLSLVSRVLTLHTSLPPSLPSSLPRTEATPPLLRIFGWSIDDLPSTFQCQPPLA